MKNLIFIILTCLPIIAFGQQNASKNSPWAVDLVYSPDSYIPPRLFGDAGFYQVSAYRIGINVVNHFEENPNWTFRSGLRYAVYNERIESFFVGQNPNAPGFQTDISFKTVKYADIPMFLRYTFGKTKLRLYAEAGGGLDIRPKELQNKTVLYWGLSLGLEYRFYERFSLFVQPIVRKSLTQNLTYFLTSGFEMGIEFSLPEK